MMAPATSRRPCFRPWPPTRRRRRQLLTIGLYSYRFAPMATSSARRIRCNYCRGPSRPLQPQFTRAAREQIVAYPVVAAALRANSKFVDEIGPIFMKRSRGRTRWVTAPQSRHQGQARPRPNRGISDAPVAPWRRSATHNACCSARILCLGFPQRGRQLLVGNDASCRRSMRSVPPNHSAIGRIPVKTFLEFYLFEQEIGHQAAKT